MKRDLDLVRSILIAAENGDGSLDALSLCDKSNTVEKIAHHVEIMRAYGLIEADTSYDMNGYPLRAAVCGLTWDGYDYLDAIRSQQVWNKAKAAISEAVGDTSLSVVKGVCTALASSMVKANLGI